MAGSEPVEAATSGDPGSALPTVGSRTHPLTGAVQGGLWAGAAVIAIGTSYLQGDRWDGVPWWAALLGVLGGGLLLGQAAGFVSWWFTRYVAARFGEPTLRRLYLAACGAGHPDAGTALVHTLGMDRNAMLADWRRWLAG